jgi:hypothetical protein
MITKLFAIVSILALGFAGVSWSGDDASSDADDTASVDAAPPADAADADADADKAKAADADKAKAADADADADSDPSAD